MFLEGYQRFILAVALLLAVNGYSYIYSATRKGIALSAGARFGGIQHCGILVKDTEKSKRFYIDIFGFEDETHLRPTTLPFDGAFLRCGDSQVHLMELPIIDPIDGRPEHGGRDRHVALTINNIDIIKEKLEGIGMPYTFSKSGRRALFCRDLDGNAYEFMEDPSLAL